eukprot:2895675-Pleurochrysis_carterae.AAC.1
MHDFHHACTFAAFAVRHAPHGPFAGQAQATAIQDRHQGTVHNFTIRQPAVCCACAAVFVLAHTRTHPCFTPAHTPVLRPHTPLVQPCRTLACSVLAKSSVVPPRHLQPASRCVVRTVLRVYSTCLLVLRCTQDR